MRRQMKTRCKHQPLMFSNSDVNDVVSQHKAQGTSTTAHTLPSNAETAVRFGLHKIENYRAYKCTGSRNKRIFILLKCNVVVASRHLASYSSNFWLRFNVTLIFLSSVKKVNKTKYQQYCVPRAGYIYY